MIGISMGLVLTVALVALAAAGLQMAHLRRRLGEQRAALQRERAMAAKQAALAQLACTGFATMIQFLPESQVRNRVAFIEAADLSQMLATAAPELAGGQASSDTRKWVTTPPVRAILRAIGQSGAHTGAVRMRALRGSLDDAFSVAIALARRAIAPTAAHERQLGSRAA